MLECCSSHSLFLVHPPPPPPPIPSYYPRSWTRKQNCKLQSVAFASLRCEHVSRMDRGRSSRSHYIIPTCFPPSSLLATTSADGTCKVWSTADFNLKTTLKKNVDKWVWDCAFSSDSQYIFTGQHNCAVEPLNK